MCARASGEEWVDAGGVAAQAQSLGSRLAPLAQENATAYNAALGALRSTSSGSGPSDAELGESLDKAASVLERIAESAADVAELAAEAAERGPAELRPDAVSAALAIQRAFASEPWPTPRPIKVRIGLHTGEAQLRDGDYYGSVVNRCARLRGIGHGGQTLLSEATAILARDRLPNDSGLLDLGEHRLKDLVRPERVFQLTGTDLPSGFPPLRTLNARPNNLPPTCRSRPRRCSGGSATSVRPVSGCSGTTCGC